jgi:hypothetical protein
MYLGSDFHRYWARCGRKDIHPDDADYLAKGSSPFNHKLLPCPFDGPLDKAKIVICLANPSDGYADVSEAQVNELVVEMRSGEEPLPKIFEKFYSKIVRPLRIPLNELRSLVAVFNVCPYTSEKMDSAAERKAAGLPSVWQAQKYLREVLIPRAQTGNIHLILIRKLQLWGVTQGEEEQGGFRVVPNRAIGAVISERHGEEIQRWLFEKGHITNQSRCES